MRVIATFANRVKRNLEVIYIGKKGVNFFVFYNEIPEKEKIYKGITERPDTLPLLRFYIPRRKLFEWQPWFELRCICSLVSVFWLHIETGKPPTLQQVARIQNTLTIRANS